MVYNSSNDYILDRYMNVEFGLKCNSFVLNKLKIAPIIVHCSKTDAWYF